MNLPDLTKCCGACLPERNAHCEPCHEREGDN